MKNTLTINTLKNCTCDCIDSIYDGSNSIFLLFVTDRNSKVEFSNGKTFEITPETNIIFIEQDWYLTNDLSFIFSNDDHVSNEFTIKKPTSTEGNMTLQMVDNFTYQVNFHKSSGGGGTATTVSVKVNSTTTGEPGTDAVVTNSGNDTNVKLDFVIPRGEKGERGPQGVQGPKGDIGPQGTQGIQGEIGPKGDTGATGATGSTGAAAGFGTPTATINNSVGTPSVSVTASGSNTAKVFNFDFKNLKGDKGDTFTYADLTDAQKTELRSDITTYYKKTYYKVSLTSDVSVVTIPDSNYRNGVDILTVYLNGVHLLEGTDYTRTTTGITLTNVAESGNVVEFDILRSIAATAEDYSKLKGDKGATGAIGLTGERGSGIYSVTTSPSSYTTETGGFKPTYRIALSTVKTQSRATKILVGDQIRYSYYLFPVGYVDSSYVYLGARVSIRGATGATGPTGPTATVDSELSETSTNAVQNSVVSKAINDIRESLLDISNILANIGTTRRGSTMTKSVPSGQTTTVEKMILPAGKWLVVGKVMYPSNNTGRRYVAISGKGQQSVQACSSGTTALTTAWFFDLTSDTDIHLQAYQSSGSTLTLSEQNLDAIRIKY